MTPKTTKNLVDLNTALTEAAARFVDLDEELKGLRAHHRHGEAQVLDEVIAPWRSALLADGDNLSRLERWRTSAQEHGVDVTAGDLVR